MLQRILDYLGVPKSVFFMLVFLPQLVPSGCALGQSHDGNQPRMADQETVLWALQFAANDCWPFFGNIEARLVDPDRTSDDPTYGFTVENPIRLKGLLAGPRGEDIYVHRLLDQKLQALTVKRLGSRNGASVGSVLDVYEMTDSTGKSQRIYIDSTAAETGRSFPKAPRGWFFSPMVTSLDEDIEEFKARYGESLARWRKSGVPTDGTEKARYFGKYARATLQQVALVLYASQISERKEKWWIKPLAEGVVEVHDAWLREQNEKYEPPPYGVLLAMKYYLGTALIHLDSQERACTEGLDQVIDARLDAFPDGPMREAMADLRLRAVLTKGWMLASTTGQPKGLTNAMELLEKQFVLVPEQGGRRAIERHVLMAYCHKYLGNKEDMAREIASAQQGIRRLRKEGGAEDESVAHFIPFFARLTAPRNGTVKPSKEAVEQK